MERLIMRKKAEQGKKKKKKGSVYQVFGNIMEKHTVVGHVILHKYIID